MEIPGLGTVTKDDRFGWYYSEPISVRVLGGKMCRIIVEGYEEDDDKQDYHTAITNFLSIDPSVLKEAEPHIFLYYEDIKKLADDEDVVTIESPSGTWRHVTLGSEPMVTRRAYGDKGIYISLEGSCDWEQEHGLQIVFKNGLKVNKVGPYDGHLTNSDAYAKPGLEKVVYRKIM
jgi:hypothetical protein